MNRTQSTIKSPPKNRVLYLFILVVLSQFTYPFSFGDSIWNLLIYQLLFTTVVILGITLTRDHPGLTRILILLAIIWLSSGIYFAFNPDMIWVQLLTYLTIAPFEAMIILVLLRFIFIEKHVSVDVLYAATAVYLLIGGVFVAVFGFIETVTFWVSDVHAFVDNVVGVVDRMPWQSFVYLSFTALTTLGFGDVLPVTFWARSIVTLESVIGVMYVTIIMARLVGLYAADRSDPHQMQKNEHEKKPPKGDFQES